MLPRVAPLSSPRVIPVIQEEASLAASLATSPLLTPIHPTFRITPASGIALINEHLLHTSLNIDHCTLITAHWSLHTDHCTEVPAACPGSLPVCAPGEEGEAPADLTLLDLSHSQPALPGPLSPSLAAPQVLQAQWPATFLHQQASGQGCLEIGQLSEFTMYY